eukprot:6233140-Karenia_brevis.AAC.1
MEASLGASIASCFEAFVIERHRRKVAKDLRVDTKETDLAYPCQLRKIQADCFCGGAPGWMDAGGRWPQFRGCNETA